MALHPSDEQLLADAEKLLGLTEEDLLSLSNDQVLSQIQHFRSAIASVTSRLIDLGDTSVQPAPALPPVPGRGRGRGRTHRRGGAASARGRGRESSVEPSTSLQGALQLPQEGGANSGSLQNPSAAQGELGQQAEDLDPTEWHVPPHCVPIHANVVTFNWKALYETEQFDVVMMDPPWQLATANPTRGVALGYSQLCDQDIANLPIPQLQRQGGFLFVWVINAKYKWTLDQFERWGYRLVDEIVWVKMTVNRRLAKSHGYYLQHAKEVCLVGLKGDQPPPGTRAGGVASDVIFSMRRGNSQKPTEIYELVEELVPNGRYLEIFARKNNLRDYWVSLGNEVTGTGLPQEDLEAIREGMDLPGAVYGRTGSKTSWY